MGTIANEAMAEAWDGEEGADWARDWERYDRASAPYEAHLQAAAAIGPTDRVLDVGCGNGATTRTAAEAASAGTALGVDLSAAMLDRARQLTADAGLANVTFLQADAQVHPFEPDSVDVVLSRFGTMFFADPTAAFANLARATAPGGRLALVAWRTPEHNEWLQEVRGALAVGRDLPLPPPGAPSPFAQADPAVVEAVLTGAGWDEVSAELVEAPFWLGADADDAFAFVSTGGVARGLLGDLDDDDRRRALDDLQAAFERHDGPDGVLLGSSAWLYRATRPR